MKSAVAALLLLLGSSSPALAQITGLGDLAGGSFFSEASGISDDGTVIVGRSFSASGTEAFRWTSTAGMVGLGDIAGGSFGSAATAVSGDGTVIVGSGSGASQQASRWTSSSGMVALGSSQLLAYGVSRDGAVVVGRGTPSSSSEAFRWTPIGVVGLGDLPGGGNASEARGVSADGTVVVGFGQSASSGGSTEAFRWTASGGMVGLGDLPGGVFQSVATATSHDGSVVIGNSASAAGNSEAFRWTAAGGMVGLGDLPGGNFFSEARGISGDGAVIVGYGINSLGTAEAWIWDAHTGMQSLQAVAANDWGMALPVGWTRLQLGNAISGDGRVIAGLALTASGQQAFRLDLNGPTIANWGVNSGDWDSKADWKWSLDPRAIDHVRILPSTGLTITGSTAVTNLVSLTIGATTGVTDLRLSQDLIAANGINIQSGGRVTLAGTLLDAGTALNIDGTGTVQGYGVILGDITGSTGLGGIGAPTRSVVYNAALDVGARSARVVSLGFANLGPDVSIAGGTIDAPNGLFLQGASNFTGHGTVNGRIAAAFGSTIRATGSLTLGDANSVTGFTSDGELYTGAATVTIHDRNVAMLGSLTQLGDGATGGTLVAGTASVSDTHDHFLLEAGKNLVGRGTVIGHFKNQGAVIGDGTAAGERIVFDTGWKVSGKGTFENTLVLGTFAPGDSPAITTGTNQAFGGTATVEIELGGLTPGFDNDDHDQINDAGVISLLPGATLSILSWDGFTPQIGDDFIVMTWALGLSGTFSNVLVDPFFTSQGLDFQLTYGNSVGPGNLTLTVVPVPEPGTWAMLALATLGVVAWRRRRGAARKGAPGDRQAQAAVAPRRADRRE